VIKKGEKIRVAGLAWALASLLAIISISGIVMAEVVVFEQYRTDTYLEKDHFRIERTVILKNVGNNPIIPGELHFKLHEVRDNEKVGSKISGFKAKNDMGTELKTRMIETSKETDLVISVWEPVLPRFTYKIVLSYNLQFEPKGILFYEVKVPVEQTTIPILNNDQRLHLPKKYHVTFAPEGTTKSDDSKGYRVVSWQNKQDMVVEYSLVPLPKMGIRAVNLFWLVIIITLIVTVFLVSRKRKT